jgi:hypothetical protein
MRRVRLGPQNLTLLKAPRYSTMPAQCTYSGDLLSGLQCATGSVQFADGAFVLFWFRRQYAVKCACVYTLCSVKNKIENETNLTDCTSNLT